MLQSHINFVESFYHSRSIWSPSDLPITDLASAFEAEFRFAPAKSHALLTTEGNMCVVDSQLEPPEQRVIAAHELAHVILHYGNQVQMVRIFRIIQEGEAMTLAGHIFAPDYLIEECIQDAPPFYETGISYLAYVFGVTYDAMRVRLDEFHRRHAEKFAVTANRGY